jgi:undecaprenyl-diphosphatase
MTSAVTILLVALVVVLIAFTVSASRRLPDPTDTTVEQRAAARALHRHPRVQRFLQQRLDRRSAGGLVLTVSLVVVFLVTLVLGALLDMVDRNSGFASWDDDLARWGVGRADSVVVAILRVVTHLGSTWVVVAALVVAVAVDLARHRNLEVVAFAAVVVIGEKLIVNGLKWVIDRDRPDVVALVSFSGGSFPSGHAAAAAAVWPAVALILARDRRRAVRASCGAMALVIGVAVAASRTLLGVHWLTDVIGGFAVGFGWFLIVATIFGGRAQRLGEPVTRPLPPTVDERTGPVRVGGR